MSNDLDKIDKILRLYENNPDKAEAEAALKKAAKLMRNYINIISKQDIISKQEPNPKSETCSGCGEEKPAHKEGCYFAKLEKRLGWGGMLGCFSCAGLLFVWFISTCIALFHQLFG